MKECNWCKSQVNKDAKVCPKCGKAIWEQKDKKRLKKLGIVLAILFSLLLIIVIILVSGDMNVEEKCKNATEITLQEIQDKITENRQNAEATYNNNYYILNGTVLHIYSKEVQIKDSNSSYSIFVKFTSDYKDDILKLKVGDKIKYCGKIKLTSTTYKIDNGCIIKND